MNDEDKKPKVIFDTTTVMQATISPDGAAGRALALMDEGKIDVYMSNQIRAEYERTLSDAAKYAQTTDKPKDQERLRNVTPEFVTAQLQRFDEKANRLVNPPHTVEYERDRKDEPFLDLASHLDADFVVAGDGDLKDLDRHPDWREWHPSMRIVSPEAFHPELSRWHEREAAQSQEKKPEQEYQPDRNRERDHEPER